MHVLVVGGAGYIGAHAARALADAGHRPVLLDNMVFGHTEVARRLGLPLVEADLNDGAAVGRALREFAIDAVMHFAAYAQVGESVREPAKYYANNVVGTLSLLDAMRAAGVRHIVFSSTCATYGTPRTPALSEDHPQAPINPYGHSKLMVEQILKDYDHAYGLRHVALRYFNAAGASADGLIGEDHDPETHLIPLCLQAVLGQRDRLTVFGTDYDTPDGTCVRDYIHVEDLATAHLMALDYLAGGGASLQLNVGTGTGYSVRQVLDCVERVTGKPVPAVNGDRREGDPAVLVADGAAIRRTFGWQPRYAELEPIVATAWQWFQQTGGRYQGASNAP